MLLLLLFGGCCKSITDHQWLYQTEDSDKHNEKQPVVTLSQRSVSPVRCDSLLSSVSCVHSLTNRGQRYYFDLWGRTSTSVDIYRWLEEDNLLQSVETQGVDSVCSVQWMMESKSCWWFIWSDQIDSVSASCRSYVSVVPTPAEFKRKARMSDRLTRVCSQLLSLFWLCIRW